MNYGLKFILPIAANTNQLTGNSEGSPNFFIAVFDYLKHGNSNKWLTDDNDLLRFQYR